MTEDATTTTTPAGPPPPPPPPPPPFQPAQRPAHWSETPPTTARARPRPGDVGGDDEPRRPWRERVPELVGGIGTVLVLAAVVGFVSATWEDLDRYGRALVLLGATGGLTAGALFLEARRRDQLTSLTSMLWLAGAGTLGAATTLALTEMLDDRTRVAIGLAGLAAAGYSLAGARRSPGSSLRQLGVVGGLLYAAGPFGTAVGDAFGPDDLVLAVDPLVALFIRDAASDAFAVTGVLHLAIGAGWLLWATRTAGRAARIAWVGSTLVVTYAALELHALPTGIGAFGALLVVLGYLVFGLVTERGGAVAVGATGVLVAGSRVLWSLFSGEVATTVASFTVGLALLTWAVRARSERDPAEDVGAEESDAGDAHDAADHATLTA